MIKEKRAGAKTRLYVESPLQAGESLILEEAARHYLTGVLRLQPGEALVLFNGRDGAWGAVLESFTKKSATLRITTQLLSQGGESLPGLELYFAPLKATRQELLVEKAVELGVSRLQPIMTCYSQKDAGKPARLHSLIRQAAEQCERLSLPTVAPSISLAQLLASWPRERPLLVCLERGEARRPLWQVLTSWPKRASRTAAPFAVLIGPEGGFSTDEVEELQKATFVQPLSLGPRILRAETAGIFALSCLSAWSEAQFYQESG